ncbi:MAG: signal recognition particle protein [Tepidisphaeraceae bacterium]
MLDALTEKLTGVFRSLAGKGKISEENVREAMREVRVALLEADVNLNVVNDFISKVTEKAVGTEVINSLQPGQLMVKICYDELVQLMGPVDTKIYTVSPGPTVIMMCGLQGSGKTTTCGKLSLFLKGRGHNPMLVAADLQRPAAVQQLKVVAEQVDVPVYADESRIGEHGKVARGNAVAVCRAGIAKAKELGRDIVILDTAGRLAIDDELMGELRDINDQLKPQQIFLVLDSMTGQDAVESAKRFNEQLELDGLILTKLDSDTRGGALLSSKVVTGKPIKFLGIGEKLERLEEFRPEGMASRILGMGDVVGLVNEAMDKFNMEEAEKLNKRLEKGQFTLDDFIHQMSQVKKLGPMSKIMGMIPGMSELSKNVGMGGDAVEGQMKKMEAMYHSMTKDERKNPDVIEHRRRQRIATGSGVQPQDVSVMIRQFTQARDMMRAVGGMGLMGRLKLMKGLTSGGLANLGPAAAGALRMKKGGWQEKKDRNKKGRR